MTYYTVCPDCGYKLFKAGDGSNVEIYCPKCKAKLIVEIKNGKRAENLGGVYAPYNGCI